MPLEFDWKGHERREVVRNDRRKNPRYEMIDTGDLVPCDRRDEKRAKTSGTRSKE